MGYQHICHHHAVNRKGSLPLGSLLDCSWSNTLLRLRYLQFVTIKVWCPNPLAKFIYLFVLTMPQISTQKDTLYTHPLLLSWVRGHADKRPWKTLNDLKNQQLSRDEIYNIWCDSLAQRQWSNGDHSSFDPDVLPSERWAVNASFPTTHKFTGSLDQGFNHAIGIRDMCAFCNWEAWDNSGYTGESSSYGARVIFVITSCISTSIYSKNASQLDPNIR